MTKENAEAFGSIIKDLAVGFVIVLMGFSVKGCLDRFNEKVEPAKVISSCELPDEVIETEVNRHTTTETILHQGKEQDHGEESR